jgi:hypothetical protein
MARAVGQSKPRAVPGWGRCLLAGAGAGLVGALASVAVEVAMHAPLPPRLPTLWSAFVAGVLGGLLYGVLTRAVRRPVAALWGLALALATIDSLLTATLPFAAGPNPSLGIPIVGLVVPLRQVLALAGIGHLGTRSFPKAWLAADTMTHYATAVAASILVPWWARPRGR